MKYRAILIDDELNNLQSLSFLIHEFCNDIDVVGIAQSADEGIQLVKTQQPDLIFLDIKMPEKDGFQFLEELKNETFEVIIVTAFNHYAIKAIKFSAIDYLLKPVNTEELKNAVGRAIERIQHKVENEQLKNLVLNMGKNKDKMKLGLASHGRIEYVETDKIIRCESESNYTHLYLISGKKKTVSKTLKEFEEMLVDHGFLRVHQSHLINIVHIKALVKHDGGFIEMIDENSVPISRNRKEVIIKKLKKGIML